MQLIQALKPAGGILRFNHSSDDAEVLENFSLSTSTEIFESSPDSKEILLQIESSYNEHMASANRYDARIFWKRIKKDFPGLDIEAIQATIRKRRYTQKRTLMRAKVSEKKIPENVLISMDSLEKISDAKEMKASVEFIYNDWLCGALCSSEKVNYKDFWTTLKRRAPASFQLINDLPLKLQYQRQNEKRSILAARGLDRTGKAREYRRLPRQLKYLIERSSSNSSASNDSSVIQIRGVVDCPLEAVYQRF